MPLDKKPKEPLNLEDCTRVAFPKPKPMERKKLSNQSGPNKKVKKKVKSALQKRKDNDNSKYWKKKADDCWRDYIHKAGICAVNNEDCSDKLEAHHLISRSQVLARHKPINGILLCSEHHKFSTKLSPHKGPVGFTIWLENNRPEQFEFVATNRYLTGEKVNYREVVERFERLEDGC